MPQFSLRVRRHLHLFEDDVLTDDWVVLLQLKFTLLKTLIFCGIVREAGSGRTDKTDIVAHGRRGLSCSEPSGNDLLCLKIRFSLDWWLGPWLTHRPLSNRDSADSLFSRLQLL